MVRRLARDAAAAATGNKFPSARVYSVTKENNAATQQRQRCAHGVAQRWVSRAGARGTEREAETRTWMLGQKSRMQGETGGHEPGLGSCGVIREIVGRLMRPFWMSRE